MSALVKPLSGRGVVLWSAALAAVIELFTCLLRFGLKLEATRDTASTIGRLTLGIRIHHGYLGIAAAVAALVLLKVSPRLDAWARILLVIGISLVVSDLIHHFMVLWLVVGDPEFHLLYPA